MNCFFACPFFKTKGFSGYVRPLYLVYNFKLIFHSYTDKRPSRGQKTEISWNLIVVIFENTYS